MPPAALAARPLTREAARRAGAGLAKQAAGVYKAVVQGPEAEAAGYGVEVAQFTQALPYLSDAQLVHCSSHFGLRGRAVGDVASAVASELSWRIKKTPGGEASEDAAPARLSQNLRSDEVTTVFYAFSKVAPQLPEYRLLYDAIGDGLLEGLWTLNRLQSVLIATALADTDTRLNDALPAVLQPLLVELVESPEVSEDFTVDTLRFLVHSAARLPGGLTGKELEALASCTILRLGGGFSKQAHLMLSWLRLVPTPSAKEAYFNALRACGQALTKHQKSHIPAHPLPKEGLAPLVAELLAREAEQNAPPLTPPVVQDVVKGLVRISWGVHRHQFMQNRSSPSRSLSIDDWAEIMSRLVKYCEAHSIFQEAAATPSSSSSNRSTLTLTAPTLLPNWAAQALFHVLWRAQQQEIPRSSPDKLVQLPSLLTLLRLVRRFRRNVQPEPQFFAWSVRLVDVHQRTGNIEDSLLADVVNELVPLLEEKERAKLTRIITARPQSTRSSTEAQLGQPSVTLSHSLQEQAQPPLRLLQRSEEEAPDVKVVLAPAAHTQPVPEPRQGTALAASLAAGGRLWGLLAAQAQEAQVAEGAQGAEEALASRMALAKTTEASHAEFTEAQGLVTDARIDVAAAEQSQEHVAPASNATVEELQRMLQSALLRVEALESKLADQERDSAKANDERETPSYDETHHKICGHSDGWLTQVLERVEPVAEKIQPSPAAATLHLSQAFNFEQFRRAHSARLDAERMRVIVPPGHFPLWPILKR